MGYASYVTVLLACIAMLSPLGHAHECAHDRLPRATPVRASQLYFDHAHDQSVPRAERARRLAETVWEPLRVQVCGLWYLLHACALCHPSRRARVMCRGTRPYAVACVWWTHAPSVGGMVLCVAVGAAGSPAAACHCCVAPCSAALLPCPHTPVTHR